jgi:hypothetical protein
MDPKRELVAELRRLARRLGRRTVTRREFQRLTGIDGSRVYRHFDGWGDLCRAAGLAPNKPRGVLLSDDEIFAAMRDAFVALGAVDPQLRFRRHFRYGVPVLWRRGWDWRTAQAKFRAWAERNAPDFPYLEALPKEAPAARLRRVRRAAGKDGGAVQAAKTPGVPVLGDPLGFRGFLNAPVNEQGVAALFAAVAPDLGFAIESLATAFPDCEARRRIGPGRWQRVRIEFEFLARNFLQHDHDLSGCDLIVCWEHNWPDCPLEVIELKTVVAGLMAPSRRGRGRGQPAA